MPTECVGVMGKVALVTGAESGIGQATAIALGRAGADVIVHHHPARAAEATNVVDGVKAAGRRAVAIGVDLRDRSQVLSLGSRAERALGPVDILVANAATFPVGPFVSLAPEAWDDMLAVNLTAPFLVCQQIASRMLERRCLGRIIIMSSANAIISAPDQVAYAASKAGLAMLGKGMARELAPHGITVNMLAPAAISTEPARRIWDRPEAQAELPWYVPLGRLGEASEVAAAVVFLCSAAASFVTGASLAVDGGVTTSKR